LAETHTLTAKQHCYVQSTAAENFVGEEVYGPVATTAMLPLLPEKPSYPKLGAYSKYDNFTALLGLQSSES
jgi:hypothetical protein